MEMRDRLIFALDVPSLAEARRYVATLKGHVGLFKVGLELFTTCGPSIVREIHDSGHGVFLDLKLMDIPKTVERTVSVMAGMGVTLATVHAAGGRDMLKAAAEGSGGMIRVVGVTVLTSMGEDEIRAQGAASVLDLVRQRAATVKEAGLSGVVCSGLEAGSVKQDLGPDFVTVCPGVRLDDGSDRHDQKRVVTPGWAVRNGADYLVVGRPIRDAEDPAVAADEIVRQMES